jgi:hypothetical protein
MSPARSRASSRADAVRQRRTQHTQEKASRAVRDPMTRPGRYASVAPTIFVRGGATRQAYGQGGLGTPVINRAQTKPRRKFVIPIGNSGAEMIMPALPMIHLGWRLASGLIAVGLTFLVLLAWNTPAIQIDKPVLYGMNRIQPSDILAVVDVERLPIFAVDKDQMTKEIEDSFPELMNVRVAIVLPNSLEISADERKPVMAWQFGGQTVWIDAEGAMFPARGKIKDKILTISADDPPPLQMELPVQDTNTDNTAAKKAKVDTALTGPDLYKHKIDPSIRDVLMGLSKQIPIDTTLVYNKTEGYGWKDKAGWRVFIGQSLENLNLKLTVYKGVVNELKKQDIKPALINVAHVDAPYYRLEQ